MNADKKSRMNCQARQDRQEIYAQMQETLSKFDAAEQLTAKIIGDRTKLTSDEVRALFRQGESKNPQFALDKGIIHEIRDVKIEQGAPVHSLMAA